MGSVRHSSSEQVCGQCYKPFPYIYNHVLLYIALVYKCHNLLHHVALTMTDHLCPANIMFLFYKQPNSDMFGWSRRTCLNVQLY